MAVLGDSFTAPSPASAGPEWPKLLGDSLDWRVFSNTVDASGYVNPGAGRPFGARVQGSEARRGGGRSAAPLTSVRTR